MAVNLNTQIFQLFLKQIRAGLACVVGDHDAAHVKSLVGIGLNEAENVYVVGNSQIRADLVLLNISRVDGDDNLSLICQLKEHPELAVWGKTGEHPGSVIIVKQLSAEFQIKLVAELSDSLADVIGLHFQILVIIESCSHSLPSLSTL